MEPRRHAVLVALALTGISVGSGATANAQQKLRDWSVAKNWMAEYDEFGYAVAGPGDVDGDGVPDAVVSAPWADPITYDVELGVTYVISGATGSILQQFNGTADQALFGWTLCAPGDLDGDGVGDWLSSEAALSARGPGTVYAYSGSTGASLFTLTGGSSSYAFGIAIGAVGDVDADGVPDFGVGDDPTGSGRVFVYSGKTQSLIYLLKGQSSTSQAYIVSGLGDLDSDGLADFGIGAVGDGPNSEGVVYAYSGATRKLIYSLVGEQSGSAFGGTLASLGDVDADGLADFAVGALAYSGTNVWQGRVYAYSAASGTLLFTFDGTMYVEKLGHVLPSNGSIDFNDDGYADIPIGSPARNAAFVYSGRNGTLLYEILGGTPGGLTETMGSSISSIGDVDGDGIDDMLIGAATNSDPYSWAGRAYVFGGNDLFLQANQPSYQPYDPFSLEIRGGAAGAASCVVLTGVNGTATFFPIVFGNLDSNGTFALTGTVPPGLSGLSLTFMAFAIGAGGGLADSISETITFQ